MTADTDRLGLWTEARFRAADTIDRARFAAVDGLGLAGRLIGGLGSWRLFAVILLAAVTATWVRGELVAERRVAEVRVEERRAADERIRVIQQEAERLATERVLAAEAAAVDTPPQADLAALCRADRDCRQEDLAR